MKSSSSSASSSPSPPPPRNVKIRSHVQDSPNGDSFSTAGVNGSHANRMWRDSSYDFTNDAVMRAAAASREFDFVAESPAAPKSPLPKLSESPREVRVSFNENTAEPLPEAAKANRRSNAEPAEVLVCSSNNSFRRKSSLLRAKTKSRLLDPPEENNQKSHTQRMFKSQVLGKGTSEFDEDDPFLDEDLPEDYKNMKCSVLSVMQLLGLIMIVAALVCSLTFNFFRKRSPFGLDLWKWVLMVLVLISGRLVSGWAIRIVVFFIERNFLLRKRVLYFVYGLRKPVQNCVWLTLVLIAWQSIFDERVEKVTNGKILPYVTKIWVCLLVGTLIWLLKTLIVKVLASSFHVSTFFDRIQEALFTQYVIETISGPPLIEIQLVQEDEERVMVEVQKLQSAGTTIPADLKANVIPKSGRMIDTPRKSTVLADAKSPRLSKMMSNKEGRSGITVNHLHRMNQKNVSAWNMKRLMNIVRKGVISTLDERIQGSTAEDESMVQITSENQAKAAAKKIFINVARPGAKRIYQEDLLRFLREDEAVKAMHLFEGACEQKGISKRDLKNWLVNAFRERRALALSLNDTKTAVNKLHQMMNALVGVIVIVIWLLILKVATTHFFIFLSSQLLLVVFVFGNACKTTFEAIIFLFVMHPFDVGDRVEVDGVQMIVEEMNILTTIFLRYDSLKIYYPNSVLSTKPINNFYRSPDMGDSIDFCIHISTPVVKIALMKERIIRYIENKTDHWNPAPSVVMRDIEDMNRLKWSVWLSHKMNHQDMGERWARRALLVEEMIKIFRELDIEYRLLPLDVNVRNMPPLSSARLPSNWAVSTT